MTFYFVAEKRIDFRELVRELFRCVLATCRQGSRSGAHRFVKDFTRHESGWPHYKVHLTNNDSFFTIPCFLETKQKAHINSTFTFQGAIKLNDKLFTAHVLIFSSSILARYATLSRSLFIAWVRVCYGYSYNRPSWTVGLLVPSMF